MKLALILGAVALALAKDDQLIRDYFRTIPGSTKNSYVYHSENKGMHWNSMHTLKTRLQGLGYDGYYRSTSKYVTGAPSRRCAVASDFERRERITQVKINKSVCFMRHTIQQNGKYYIRMVKDHTGEVVPLTNIVPDKNIVFWLNHGSKKQTFVYTTSSFNHPAIVQLSNAVPACLHWQTLSHDLWGECSYSMDWQHIYEQKPTHSFSVARKTAIAKSAFTSAKRILDQAKERLTTAKNNVKKALEQESSVSEQLEECQNGHKESLSTSVANDFRYRMESIYVATRDMGVLDIGYSSGGSEEDEYKSADVWWQSGRPYKHE